jgi:hypothetical protein
LTLLPLAKSSTPPPLLRGIFFFLQVVGSAAALNEALMDLRYEAKAGEEGWDEIAVTLSDTPLDVCGLGAARNHTGQHQGPGRHSRSGGGGPTTGSGAAGSAAGEGAWGEAGDRFEPYPADEAAAAAEFAAGPRVYEPDVHNASASMRW